jgi:MFS transporter, putative metabolite:H+ symporter
VTTDSRRPALSGVEGPDGPAAPDLIARLESVPFSRWHLRARMVVGSATFFDAFDALSLAFVLPVLAPRWGLSSAQIGWLIAAGYLGQFVGALVFGTLAERFGRIRSAAGATALMSIMSLACAGAGSLSWLLALRFVQGIGVGGEMPVAAVYINELSRAQGRGRFFMLYEMIFPVGLMATGQIGALLVPALGWRIMFLLGGIPGLFITLLLLRLPESPRWLIAKGRLALAEAVIGEIERSTDRRVALPNQDGAASGVEVIAGAQRSRWSELLSRQYRGRTAVVWTLWTSAYFITNGLNNWMPTLYNRAYHLTLQQSLRAGTLTNVAQVAILLGCAFVIDRLGRRRWTVACFAAGTALLAALGLLAAQSVAAVVLLVSVSYGIVGSVNAVLYLYTPEIYPTRMRAIGTGAATCWLRLASAAAPLLVGYLVDAKGTGSVFLTFAAAGVIGALAATRMVDTDNRRLEDLAS